MDLALTLALKNGNLCQGNPTIQPLYLGAEFIKLEERKPEDSLGQPNAVECEVACSNPTDK